MIFLLRTLCTRNRIILDYSRSDLYICICFAVGFPLFDLGIAIDVAIASCIYICICKPSVSIDTKQLRCIFLWFPAIWWNLFIFMCYFIGFLLNLVR